jgi:two-component system nitrogen regulation sensor histidine kinase NtrY
MRPVKQLLRALSGTVASYKEGDFSLSLAADRDDELGELMVAHNELAGALRTQRAHLVQRELLLDTVMQNSPVALLLVDANERIAIANLAARHLLSEGRSLQGLRFPRRAEACALRDWPRRGADHGQPVLRRSTAWRSRSICRSAPSYCKAVAFRLYLLKG